MNKKKGQIDKATFKQISRDHWEEFKRAYAKYNTAYHDRVIRKMLDCGDPEKAGYATYLCPEEAQKAIYKIFGIDWNQLPVTKTIIPQKGVAIL